MVKHVVLREHPPLKIYLEVEIFDLNKNEEEVMAFVGEGDSYEDFKVSTGAEKGGQIDDWPPIEGHKPSEKAFRVELKRELWKKTIKIQAKRKHIAYKYDDGERAMDADISDELARHVRKPGNKDLVKEGKNKKGKWPDNVKLDYWDKYWPTEEHLTRIYIYPKNEESKYNTMKTEEVVPLLNKILILQRGGEIEYVVDRFVSF